MRQYEARRDMLLAYQAGAFSGLAFNGKLKSFDHYAKAASGDATPIHAKAISFFHSMRAKGLPVTIEKVTRH